MNAHAYRRVPHPIYPLPKEEPNADGRYAERLARARALAADLALASQELERLEALADGRRGVSAWRWLRPLAAAAVTLAALLAATGPGPARAYGPLVAPGLALWAAWCGDAAGVALRRLHARPGIVARVGSAALFLLFSMQAAMAAALAWNFDGGWLAGVLGGGALMGLLAAYAASSGDPVADRVHAELVAARRQARHLESDLEAAQASLRAAHTADLSKLSRVAPWPAVDGEAAIREDD